MAKDSKEKVNLEKQFDKGMYKINDPSKTWQEKKGEDELWCYLW